MKTVKKVKPIRGTFTARVSGCSLPVCSASTASLTQTYTVSAASPSHRVSFPCHLTTHVAKDVY